MYKRWDYNELYKFTHKAERLTLQGDFKEVIPMMKELFQGFYEAQDVIDIFVRYLSFIANLTVNIIINYTIDDFDEYGEKFLYNYEFTLEFFNSNEYPYRFYVANNQLEIYAYRSIGTGIIKTYDGFTLNIKRILEDEAYIFDFFKKHFKQDYKEVDKKKIIEQLHRYNEVKIRFPLDDLL